MKAILDLITSFLPQDKLDENQNWYNDTETEKDVVRYKGPVIEEEKVVFEDPIHVHPVQIQRVTSSYGWRKLPAKGAKRSWHSGTDYTGRNTECFAVTDSVVVKYRGPDIEYPVKFKWDNRIGKFVYIRGIPSGRAWTPYVVLQSIYDSTVTFHYKHVDPTVIAIGQRLNAGDKVADIGNYGYSMGAHLHFEVRINGKTVNPVKWLAKKIKKENSGKLS